MISFTKTIVFRLWLICIIMLVLPLCGNIFFLGIQNYRNAYDQASKVLLENSYIKTQLILHLLDLNKTFIQLLIPSLNLEKIKTNDEKKDLSLKLKELFSNQFHEISIILTNKDGKQSIIISTEINQINEFNNLKTIPPPYCTQKIIIDFVEDSPKLSIETCTKFIQKDESIISVFTIYKPTTILPLILHNQINNLANTALITPNNEIIKINNDNTFTNKEKFQGKNFAQIKSKLFLNKINLLKNNLDQSLNIQAISFTQNYKKILGYKILIPGTDIFLFSYASKSQILKPFNEKILSYSIYITFIILSAFISLLISRKFSKPIQQLDAVMTKLQNKQLNTRYQPDPYGFEINHLGLIFNHMVDQLLKQQHKIEDEIIKKELLSKELFLGEQAQDILLSTVTPYYPNIKISKIYIPATIVSGDFYDIFIKNISKNQEELFLIVADASGKGVSGCCYSLILKNFLATYLKECNSMEEAIFLTNQMFQQDTKESGMFVTAAIIKYNHNNKSLSYYSCGHPPICYIKKDGSSDFIYHPGIAFGIKSVDKSIKPIEIPICSGDVIVMYSDGITEAHNENNVLFGTNRLQQILSSVHHLSTFDISHFIIHKINHFVKTQEQYDDITILVIKIEENE